MFQRLRDKGLKLKPSKCCFFQHEIKYLGHVVSEDGVATDPYKVWAVKAWAVLATAEELKCFIGFVGFYRRFIKDFKDRTSTTRSASEEWNPVHQS